MADLKLVKSDKTVRMKIREQEIHDIVSFLWLGIVGLKSIQQLHPDILDKYEDSFIALADALDDLSD